MPTSRRQTRWSNGGALVVALLIGLAAFALAIGGEAAAEEEGVIYVYLEEAGYYGNVYKLNPDGSGLTVLFPVGAGEEYKAEPSRESHGGRWFLQVRDVYSGQSELFAVHESGWPAVQLTDDAYLRGRALQRWLPSDTAISWKARRWEDTDGDGVRDRVATLPDGRYDMGIYVLDIDFSAGWPVPVGQPRLLDWTASLPYRTYQYEEYGEQPICLLMGFDWFLNADPGEGFVAYEVEEELYVADAQTGDAWFVGTEACDPRWSPNGGKIAFVDLATVATTGYSSVGVINPDGTGRTTVAAGNGGVMQVRWSPDGTHLAYALGRVRAHGSSSQWVYRVALDGSGNTKLTGSYGLVWPLGWRTAEPAPLQITTDNLPGGVLGQAYSATLEATGGTEPYGWLVLEGALPDGLVLDEQSGTISGTPAAEGEYGFVVLAMDSVGQEATQQLTIAVTASGPAQVTVVSVKAANMRQGGKYNITAAISNDSTGALDLTVQCLVEDSQGGWQDLAPRTLTLAAGATGTVKFNDYSTLPKGTCTATVTVEGYPDVGDANWDSFTIR